MKMQPLKIFVLMYFYQGFTECTPCRIGLLSVHPVELVYSVFTLYNWFIESSPCRISLSRGHPVELIHQGYTL